MTGVTWRRESRNQCDYQRRAPSGHSLWRTHAGKGRFQNALGEERCARFGRLIRILNLRMSHEVITCVRLRRSSVALGGTVHKSMLAAGWSAPERAPLSVLLPAGAVAPRRGHWSVAR